MDLRLIEYVAWISTIDMEVLDQYKTKHRELATGHYVQKVNSRDLVLSEIMRRLSKLTTVCCWLDGMVGGGAQPSTSISDSF